MEIDTENFREVQEEQGPFRMDKVNVCVLFNYIRLYSYFVCLPVAPPDYFSINFVTYQNVHPKSDTLFHFLSDLSLYLFLMDCKFLNYVLNVSAALFRYFFHYFSRCCHLLIVSSLVYIILKFFSPKRAFWLSFILSLTYSSWAHLYRMQVDYGGYSADVSL